MSILISITSASHYLSDYLGYIPFIGMVAGDKNNNPFVTRIVEAVIIAMLAGYVSGKVTLAQIEVRLDSVETKVSKIFDDIYRPSIPSGDE